MLMKKTIAAIILIMILNNIKSAQVHQIYCG